ncbi:MAG: RNA-metabolising metallo-beta-lactamase [candidate division WWE3 bacterium GW2011_GWA2_46_9]|uniref:RNA-metabolising metallo-beta-lactamase n=1 Tax=candidate division WWE3 bacterium GW2011_GWA2_46_9 TaxID=1619111 RepID=A0A0G1QTU0_UNCKA|nr:MAG: RNA-metabolising metallo-beta-lactamase [candidate division WWE3 bacterium GW2011_GWA2_46_9]
MTFFDNTKNTSKNEPFLRIIAIGGTASVNTNLTVYEYGDDIIVVDCGIGFPDDEQPGVDVIIPDFSYLIEHKNKVRALFLTHGHADHIDAVPYFLQELNVPVYAGKLVQGLIKEKLKEKRFKSVQDAAFNLISPETPEVRVGAFSVSAFRLNHSVPSTVGFAIKTPQGLVMHMADYKIDWTPVLDKPVDMARIAQLAGQGVLCLLSDCLGSTSEGFSKSERSLNDTFIELFERAEGRQVLVTTISSNISRMYQIITAAVKHGRKVVFSGRSIEQGATVARGLGYLKFADSVFVPEKDAKRYLQKDLVYIVAGCYGQPESSLGRLSRNENKDIELEDNALVIFSAKGDLITMASVVRPKYFIPIGGTVTKMRAYKNMIGTLGFNRDTVFELLAGESVVFSNGMAQKGDRVDVKDVYLEMGSADSVSPVVLRDRQVLSDDGVFVVVIPLTGKTKEPVGKVEIITRGFVYVKESQALIGRSRDVINKALDKFRGDFGNWGVVKSTVEKEIERFLFRETGRRPLIIVSSLIV